jgi:uncharacterized membrane protein YeaQ/YmgE (transglycosylase-associated protein family)
MVGTLLIAATEGCRRDVLFINRARTSAPEITVQGKCRHGAEGQVQGMTIISWIILGLLAGAIAKFLLPGRDPGGFIGTTLIGIAGAFIGGWISARWLDHPITKDFYDGTTWAAAIGGSLVLLIAYRLLFGNSRN